MKLHQLSLSRVLTCADDAASKGRASQPSPVLVNSLFQAALGIILTLTHV